MATTGTPTAGDIRAAQAARVSCGRTKLGAALGSPLDEGVGSMVGSAALGAGAGSVSTSTPLGEGDGATATGTGAVAGTRYFPAAAVPVSSTKSASSGSTNRPAGLLTQRLSRRRSRLRRPPPGRLRGAGAGAGGASGSCVGTGSASVA